MNDEFKKLFEEAELAGKNFDISAIQYERLGRLEDSLPWYAFSSRIRIAQMKKMVSAKMDYWLNEETQATLKMGWKKLSFNIEDIVKTFNFKE